MQEKKNKHMNMQDRIEIQECLYKKMTFKAIGKLIGKDPTTVSKEVKLHATNHKNGFVRKEEMCPQLLKAPFVCNGCRLKSSAGCQYIRRMYVAKTAQKEYEETLVSSREGVVLNQTAFYENDKILTKQLKQGQHMYHILQSPNITFSKSSAYRYMHKGYLSASATDLPRVVKFKQRKKTKDSYIPKGIKIGRSYSDFLAFIDESSISNYSEMDTVIGRVGGKVIVTIHFTAMNFMFGLLADNKTAAAVSSKISFLKNLLVNNNFSFGDVFPVILTDNGGEFADVLAVENDSSDNAETKLFFCDPMQSSQKPFIEKNHTLFRDIVPKGTSFDSFTQDTVNLIFSHVNSVRRKSLNGKTPYEMFSFIYGDTLANLLGVHSIPSDDVIQSTILQKSKSFIDTISI